MRIKILHSLIVSFFCGFLPTASMATTVLEPVQAHISSRCQQILKNSTPITMSQLKARVEDRVAKAFAEEPPPTFEDLEAERRVQWSGAAGPQALTDTLPKGASFEKVPVPGTEHPGAVRFLSPGRTFPVRVEVPFKGRTTTTNVFATLPKPQKLKNISNQPYLVDDSYPYAIIHIHGGGTPTATGANAGSIGERLAKYGMPVLGPDMPGHGKGDRGSFASIEEIIDWILVLADQLVHPDVKLIISGHSWGAEFTAFMHRMSDQPKMARIEKFITQSPPVDTSMGGDPEEKLKFDKWWEENFHEFEEDISPTDFDFLTNLVENGKISPVATYYTTLTAMGYHLPPLSIESQKELKPNLVMVGHADGLVYVGREKFFEAQFGNLQSPSEFIVLPPGKTFNSNGRDVSTGHNIFDLYMEGTEKEFVYYKMVEFIVGKENMADWRLPKPKDDQSLTAIIDKIRNYYANNLIFQEFLQTRVEYVRSATPRVGELTQRRKELSSFMNKIDKSYQKFLKERQAQLVTEIQQAAIDLGLSEKINPKKAQWELERPDRTPEREAELEKFIADFSGLEKQLLETFEDPNQEQLQQLAGQYSTSGYESAKNELAAIENSKPLNDDQKQRRSSLSSYIQKAKELGRESQTLRDQQLHELVRSTLVTPDGINSVGEARRELNTDTSVDYRNRLMSFLERHKELEQSHNASLNEAWQKRLNELPWPEGLNTMAELENEIQKVDQIFDDRYVPASQPELSEYVKDIESLQQAISQVRDEHGSLDRLEKQREAMLKQRDRLVRELVSIWENGELENQAIDEAKALKNQALDDLLQVHQELSHMQQEYLVAQDQRGLLEEALLVRFPEQIQQKTLEFRQAKQVFQDAKTRVQKVMLLESFAGHLNRGPDGQRASQILKELIGDETYLQTKKAAPDSLIGRIHEQEDRIEHVSQRLVTLQKALDQLKYDYLSSFKDAGSGPYFSIQKVEIAQLLDQPIENLVAELSEDSPEAAAKQKALIQMLEAWEDLWKKVLSEQQYLHLDF